MNTLKTLQEDLMRCLVEPSSGFTPKYLVSNSRLSAQQSISIYRRSILGNHLAALQEIYPVCCRLVGESFFHYAITHFLKRYKHQHFDISTFGEDLPEFFASFESARSLVYLPDVAQLEWGCHLAGLGARVEPFNFEALAQISDDCYESLVFNLPSNSMLMKSKYPVLTIWQANQPDAQEQSITLDSGEESLLVWRHGLDLKINRLDDKEWFCLNHFLHRRSLGKMFDALKNKFHLTTTASQDFFLQMLQRGWLVGFAVLQ